MKKMLIAGLLLIPIVLSQTPGLVLNRYGYGETSNKIIFTIHCSGEEPVSNLTVYVDGEEYEEIYTYLEPTKGITTTLDLEPGKHLVEVRSLEGAYDSIEVTVGELDGKPPEDRSEKIIWIFGVALGILVVAFILKQLILSKR